MPIHGKRFALDHETTVQYAITFTNGTPTALEVAAKNSDDIDPFIQDGSGTFIAYDDTGMKGTDQDGVSTYRRPVYEISYTVKDHRIQITDCNIAPVEMDEPLPPQHGSDKADIIRDLTSQKTAFNPSSRRPTNNNGGGYQGTRPGQKQSDDLQPGERRGNFKVPDAKLEKCLKDWCSDLTKRADNGQLDPVIGRDQERQDIRQLLLRKKRSSVMLLGDAGVGKSALAEALAQDIVEGRAEAELGNARVVSLNLQAMNAGTQFRGTFEERLLPILEGLEERGGYLKGQKVVLFIDEIHSALTAGHSQGGTSAGEIMKPFLARDGLTCLGATTPEEYKKHIEPNKAMVRRFQPYTLEAPGTEDTKLIIQGVADTYAKHHGLTEDFDEEVLNYIVDMTDRFMPTQHQPDKAISIIDDAAATARLDGRSVVEKTDVVSALAKATGLKRDFLDQSDFKRYETLGEDLEKDVLDQPGVHTIANELKASRMGLSRDQGPRGSFILPGPTGVGKTELAKALARALTGNEDNLIRIDMGDFKEAHSASGLTGAPPGYVGYDNDDSSQLTEGVRNKPFSILLLDEVEKAHPSVFDSLLSILDDGKLKDKKGRVVDYTNTIILMTTNLGAQDVQAYLSGNKVGFKKLENGDSEENNTQDQQQIAKITQNALTKHFKAEFLNRVDAVVPFYALQKSAIEGILVKELKDVEKSLQQSTRGLQLNNVKLEISKDVKAALAEKGYDRKYGARPLRRAVKNNLTNQLAHWMMQNKDDLVERNKKGPFKIIINEIGENFKPKVQKIAQPKPKTPAA
ncbi:MAG: AAA family ATPase [Pseudomonadota bacterium]